MMFLGLTVFCTFWISVWYLVIIEMYLMGLKGALLDTSTYRNWSGSLKGFVNEVSE